MKLQYVWAVFIVVPCLGHDYEQLGAARIIHTIRSAEQALVQELHGHPRFLLSEERILHKASLLALDAGKLRAAQMKTGRKLRSIEASLKHARKSLDASTTSQASLKHAQKSSDASTTSGAMELDSMVRKESQLLRGGHSIIKEVQQLKGDFKRVLGERDPKTAAKLVQLMDNVDKAQQGILVSEAEAAVHTSRLASLHEDPVKREKLEKKAEGQLKAAKAEVLAAYGNDDATAKQVEAMIDKVEGSLQGLEKHSDVSLNNFKKEETDMFADIERKANQPTKKADSDAKKAETDTKSRHAAEGNVNKANQRAAMLQQRANHGFDELANMLVH